MPHRTTVAATGIMALGLCLLLPKAFVPTTPAQTAPPLPALRGATATVPAGSAEAGSVAGGAAAVGLAVAAALATISVKGRTALRAEPVSAAAAAAAAAAAKSAAATGATKTAAAVAGSAGTGSLKQAADQAGEGGSPKGSGSGGSGFNPANMIGVTEPLGYFDPAGFCKVGDEKTFRNYRTAEIKHGRAAMMAALGAVVQHYVKFPGFEDVPSGLAAVNTPPGSYGFIALLAAAGALELGVWVEKDDKAPGDFGNPLPWFNDYDEDMRNRELNNGRAAMFAAIGIIVAELYTGKDAVEQLVV
mmetsp:Transcript_132553/g.369548  ORF Transcript_132553/g.369548 Transcript_132553/m.369548 type:complete len:303 (-) Transcript_132553:301-1209(-)